MADSVDSTETGRAGASVVWGEKSQAVTKTATATTQPRLFPLAEKLAGLENILNNTALAPTARGYSMRMHCVYPYSTRQFAVNEVAA